MSFLRAGRIAAARCILAAPARRRMAALVGVEIDSDAPEVGVLTLQRPPVARPSGIAARQNQAQRTTVGYPTFRQSPRA